jgi:hypothetical protein
MAAGRDRETLWPITTRRNDDMNLRTTKNPIFCPMGLRRAMPTALALVATLALVASAQAQTYTWTGAGSDNNWFTNNATFASDNFSSTPLASSLTTTDLVFAGSTRPSTSLNLGSSPSSFNARSLTFNTSVDFTINQTSGVTSRTLFLGLGGIDNQVALKQTINTRVNLSNSGTTPIHVASGGEIAFVLGSGTSRLTALGAGVAVEKTGDGTLTLGTHVVSNFIISAGTVNDDQNSSVTSYDLRGGVLNLDGAMLNVTDGYFRQSGGVSNINGGTGIDVSEVEITGGTVNFNYEQGGFYSQTTISGGTIAYNGPVGDGVNLSWPTDGGKTNPITTISGGVHDFGAGSFEKMFDEVGEAVLVTGGTSTGFNYTEGLTNDGGLITFTAIDAGLSPTYRTPGPATNGGVDLTLTSGTVSISTIGGSTPEIGALVNGTIANPLNTFLGAGNTLNLDFNEDLSRDLLITSGTLNWGGNVALNLTNLGAVADFTTWDFFNDGVLGNTGAFAGTLSGISLAATDTYNGLTFSKSGSLWTSTATPGGQQFTFNETTGVLAVVPEPSSIAVVGMGLAMLGWRRLALRRRAAA